MTLLFSKKVYELYYYLKWITDLWFIAIYTDPYHYLRLEIFKNSNLWLKYFKNNKSGPLYKTSLLILPKVGTKSRLESAPAILESMTLSFDSFSN